MEGGGGCRDEDEAPEMKPSSLCSFFKSVYITSQLCHNFLSGAPLLRKILDLPLLFQRNEGHVWINLREQGISLLLTKAWQNSENN